MNSQLKSLMQRCEVVERPRQVEVLRVYGIEYERRQDLAFTWGQPSGVQFRLLSTREVKSNPSLMWCSTVLDLEWLWEASLLEVKSCGHASPEAALDSLTRMHQNRTAWLQTARRGEP